MQAQGEWLVPLTFGTEAYAEAYLGLYGRSWAGILNVLLISLNCGGISLFPPLDGVLDLQSSQLPSFN